MTLRQLLALYWADRHTGAAIFAAFGTFYLIACILGGLT